MNRNSFYIVSAVVLLFFYSCQGDEIYYNFEQFTKSEWSRNDTLYFEIDSTSVIIGKPLDCNIEIVNTSDYPYRNIWLYIQDDFSDSIYTHYEKQYELCDEYGKWYGSGFGSVYMLSLNYKRNIILKEKRNYKIKMVHGMRDEPLTGIDKVGIKLYESSTAD